MSHVNSPVQYQGFSWLNPRLTYWTVAIWSVLWIAGCSRTAPLDATLNPGEKSYPLTGEILKVEPERKILVVQHEEIVGLMPAMTMEFAVGEGDLANAKVGQRISAQLVTAAKGNFRLERIWPADPTARSAIDAAANVLTQDTVARGRKAYREVGEKAPDFALYDQEGRVVQSARFRGKKILLNFIFTRCPVPTMCPASVARFQQTQQIARAAGVANLELISVSLDPTYDSPGVLKEYAVTRGIDTSNYTLLTGPEGAIKSLLAQFGVLAEFDGKLVTHTLATLLIDENGRIIDRADGSQWSVDDFVRKMR